MGGFKFHGGGDQIDPGEFSLLLSITTLPRAISVSPLSGKSVLMWTSITLILLPDLITSPTVKRGDIGGGLNKSTVNLVTWKFSNSEVSE